METMASTNRDDGSQLFDDRGADTNSFEGWVMKTKDKGTLSEEDKCELFIELSSTAKNNLHIPMDCHNSLIQLSMGMADFKLTLGFDSILNCWSEMQSCWNDNKNPEVVFDPLNTSSIASIFAKTSFLCGWKWEKIESSGIDKNLIQDRSQSILHYSSIPFLHDVSVSEKRETFISAKVRVMPSCWYLLLKCHIKSAIGLQIIETRFFHKFNTETGEVKVYREVSEQCVKWEQLDTLKLPHELSSMSLASKLPELPQAGTKLYYCAVKCDIEAKTVNQAADSLETISETVSELAISGGTAESDDLEKSSPSAKLLTQCEYYFSDTNLPKDTFMLNQLKQSGNDMVPIQVLTTFNKMKKLLKKLKVHAGEEITTIADVLRSSTVLKVSEDGTEVGRKLPLPAPQLEEDPVSNRTMKVSNLPKNATQDSIRCLFDSYSEVLSVAIPSQFRGSAQVVLGSLGGAIRACEKMNDDDNWRSGLRVEFANNWSLSQAKKQYNKMIASKKKNTNVVEAEMQAIEAIPNQEEIEVPEGRQRGKILKFKGSFGFIKPLHLSARKVATKADNVFFSRSLLEEGSDLPQVGDLVEYDFVLIKNKPNGINIQIVERVKSKAPIPVEVNSSSSRPELFKSRLQPLHVKMAKGPDGSLGFKERIRACS